MKLLLVFFILRPGDGAFRLDERPDFAPVRMSSPVQCVVLQQAINSMPRPDPKQWYSVAACTKESGT